MESVLKITALSLSNQLAPFVDLVARWSLRFVTSISFGSIIFFYCSFIMELFDGLRKRNVGDNQKDLTEKKEEEDKPKVDFRAVDVEVPGTYWFTRIVFLRALAFVYFVAFAVAANQNKQLVGKHGLLPSDTYLRRVEEHFEDDGSWRTFLHFPTLLLYGDKSKIDWYLDLLAYSGLALSGFVFLCGCANMIIMTSLWVLYHSIVIIGQRWYSFGWESQLLETGFLAVFLCPTIKINQVPIHTPTALVVVWGYRWLIFRIMIGAGLIKIRGDQCWRDLTCMNYHYETQPVPNPMSYYMHQSPEYFHKFETLTNHFIELVVPFFILLTRPFRICCGILQILFQVTLIISGNLSFLNWLTILPSLMCFDDKTLAFLFSSSSSAKREVIRIQQLTNTGIGLKPSWGLCVRRVFEIMLGILIGYLSIPVVQNLLSSRQAMNTSFDSFRLVNTYGAFGSVTKERTEVLFQGTRNASIIPDDKGGIWQEYEFNCKPGDLKRRPCFISPYHYRLDWLMWFAAFQNYQYNPWLIHLAAKLLTNDEQATSLMAHNPFINGTPPKFIRGEHYLYEFTKVGSREAREGYWWKRTRIGTYFPPVSLEGLKNYLQSHGWKAPKLKKKS